MKKMRPITLGIIYLGITFVFIWYAVMNVNRDGWTFFTWIIIFFATINAVPAIRFIDYHYKKKRQLNNKK